MRPPGARPKDFKDSEPHLMWGKLREQDVPRQRNRLKEVLHPAGACL
jgi:hypothetical protein